MEMKLKINSIKYPIIEKKEEKGNLMIKAGKTWTDKNKYIHEEIIKIRIPLELKNKKELQFVVIDIKDYDKKEDYLLTIFSEINLRDKSNPDAFGKLIVRKGLLRKWTGLDGLQIDSAFKGIHTGHTYNLLSSLPRIIQIKENEVEVILGTGKKISGINVHNYILNQNYPLDL